jgi:hypothetical protein
VALAARAHDIEKVDFIWADMQSAEGDLVAGGPLTLAKTRFSAARARRGPARQ